MKQIYYTDEFILFTRIDWKLLQSLLNDLMDAGFAPTEDEWEGTDDHEVRVTVTAVTSAIAHDIMSKYR